MKESVIYQDILREIKGKVEGKIEGKVEGKVEEWLMIARNLLNLGLSENLICHGIVSRRSPHIGLMVKKCDRLKEIRNHTN
jgi:hypothetical protein